MCQHPVLFCSFFFFDRQAFNFANLLFTGLHKLVQFFKLDYGIIHRNTEDVWLFEEYNTELYFKMWYIFTRHVIFSPLDLEDCLPLTYHF